MLYKPLYSTELLASSFSPLEITSSEPQEFDEFEIIAEAFHGILENRDMDSHREAAIGFIRNYAVTKAGLGNSEARIAYFEAQRRVKTYPLLPRLAIRQEELQLAE